MSVENTLEERGKNYGSFEAGTKGYAQIMHALTDIYVEKHGEAPDWLDFMPIIYIVMKLVRLGATPDHIDTWHDIQGYAKLTEDMYIKKEINETTKNRN